MRSASKGCDGCLAIAVIGPQPSRLNPFRTSTSGISFRRCSGRGPRSCSTPSWSRRGPRCSISPAGPVPWRAPQAGRAGSDGYVVASDVSGPMLARAAAVGAPERRGADRVPGGVGRCAAVRGRCALTWCSASRVCSSSPRREAAVGEMWRVLRPGGVAGIAVWADRASARAIRCLR